MPANPVKGQVARKVGEDEYVLAYPFNTIVAYEAATKRKFSEARNALLSDEMSAAEVLTFLRFGLWRNHPELDDEAVGELIGVLGENEFGLWIKEVFEATWGLAEKAETGPPAGEAEGGTGKAASASGSSSTSEATASSGT